MSMIPQYDENEHQLSNSVENFFKDFKVSDALHRCGAEKASGFTAAELFRYLLGMVFSHRSMYMQLKTGSFREKFSKNTVYRFLNSAQTNWLRFTTLVSEKVVNHFMRGLTSEDRMDAFVIDDTLYPKAGYKHSELVSKVFDHVSMKLKKGFRLMTLGWTDGNSFVPINFALLASGDDAKVLGPQKKYDKRTIAGRRRIMARTKGTEVIISLLKAAQDAGHRAKYVLFDTWFSSPKCIIDIKENLDLDVIAMVKKSSKVFYQFEGDNLNIKQIYARNKKRRGRSRYLLSVNVLVSTNAADGSHPFVPAKIVFVRNRNKRNDWIAILSTDQSLSEEDVIKVYGKRWNIEVFFKACKQSLELISGCRSLSYDAMTAHVAVVFTRYMLLSVNERYNTDERSLGELFCMIADELADITYRQSLQLLIEAMLDTVREFFGLTEEQLKKFTNDFYNRLPEYMRSTISIPAAA